MSGTFMDGGGHDHGGHAMHGGGGDGGGFMDGGGHDHGHHGHSMHGSGGDGGNFLNHILGYNNDGGHHSFLSHLLGLDHDAHHHGGHADGGHGGDGLHGDGGQNPSQTPIWTSALQGMKLSHALEGINISINVWFFFFYAMCIFWLFLVYWIRHHEPLANAVLGRGAAKYETAAADRRIIDNCRDATPIRTSQTQSYYAPMPSEFHDPNAQQAIAAAAFNPNTANQPYFAPTNGLPPSATPQINLNGATHAPTGVIAPTGIGAQTAIVAAPGTAAQAGAGTIDMATFYNQGSPFGAPTVATPIAPPQVIPNVNGPGHMIVTPMPLTPGAQRLKMIINK